MASILILGSNSDVGIACAYHFAQQGYDLMLATRTINHAQERLATDIAIRYQRKVDSIIFDALKMETHQPFFDNLPVKPAIVISVFGVLGNHERAIEDFYEAERIIATNYLGNVSILGIIANYMENQKTGTIACVSSVAGERGRQSNYFYGSSKAALTAFLSGLRASLVSSNVHVATIIPGFIKTKMIADLTTPKILTASSEQVAKAIWKACKHQKNIVYVLPIWRWIMFIIKSIPEWIFKKLKL